MNKEVANDLDNLTSLQNVSKMDTQSEKHFDDRKICEKVTCYLDRKDSIEDFIRRHSVFIENNINTRDFRVSNSSSVPDFQKIFKSNNINPVHYFGNELLISVLLNSNIKLNKLMYTLALDMKKEKHNRKLKRFIKLLRKNQNIEVDKSKQNNKEKTVNNSCSSHLAHKFSNVLSNSNEECIKDITQFSTVPSSDRINKYSSKIEIHQPPRPISNTDSVSSQQQIKKPFNKKVQEIYSDLLEDYLYSNKTKSKFEVTSSEPGETDAVKINTLGESKSLEDIGNLIDKQITSINFLIGEFKELTNTDNLCQKNTAEVDYNIAKRKKTGTHDESSLFGYGKHETQRPSSCIFKMHNTLEDRNVYAKIRNEIKKIYQKINLIDHPKILKDIENKIDQLINSIQLLILEIQEQKLKEKENNLHSHDLKNKTDCNIFQNKNIYTVSEASSLSNEKYEIITQTSSYLLEMVKILQNKNIKIKDEIKRNVQPNCYYGSTLKLCLTEKATEITKSFNTAEFNVSEAVMTGSSVNLDQLLVDNKTENIDDESLNILGPLKICTQFVKQLLSWVPALNSSHCGQRKFSFLKGDREAHYVCHNCEEIFYKASMLNEHMKVHNSDIARDSDVCKHVLEKHKLDSGEHFECQFCKKRFMRAYCCELHQQSCAKRLGLRQDISSNLLLLQ